MASLGLSTLVTCSLRSVVRSSSSAESASPSSALEPVRQWHRGQAQMHHCSSRKHASRCTVKRADVPRAAGERYEFQPDVSAEVKRESIVCSNCTGNGAVVCSQCKGSGLNSVDHFEGRFKAGQTCWLCRGKKQMLCGECNGAGFVGGFLSTQDE